MKLPPLPPPAVDPVYESEQQVVTRTRWLYVIGGFAAGVAVAVIALTLTHIGNSPTCVNSTRSADMRITVPGSVNVTSSLTQPLQLNTPAV